MGMLYKLDFENGKSYIGITTKTARHRFTVHKYSSTRESVTSVLYTAWRKYGAPTMTVLAVLENAELYSTEKRAISVYNTKTPHGYNLSSGGEGEAAANRSIPQRERQRQAMLGKKKTPEAVEKCRRARMGMKLPPEWCENMGKARLGKKLSVEHKAKVAAAHIGRKNTPETIEKMRKAATGRKHTDETKQKIREINIGKTYSDVTKNKHSMSATGRKHSDHARALMSKASLGRVVSDETKQKLREINLGKRHSDAAKLKCSVALKGRVVSEATRAKISAASTARNPKTKCLCGKCNAEMLLTASSVKEINYCSKKCWYERNAVMTNDANVLGREI